MSQIHDLKEKNELQRKLNLTRQINYLQERLFRYSKKYNSIRQIALHMANACLISLRFYRRKNQLKISGPLKICIKVGGGLGDVLVRLNWVCGFYNKFHSAHTMQIYVAGINKNLLNSFLPKFITSILSLKEAEKNYFDLEICLDVRIPVVHYANVNRLSGDLLKYVERLVAFGLEYKDIIIRSAYKDSITNNILSESKKWFQHPDILNEFHLTEDFLLPIRLHNQQETLMKFHLISKKYITVNREVGDKNLMDSTKLWPLPYYRELIEAIKQHYPQYQIVEIGTGKGERIGNTHLNLAGKTSLEEVKVILKNAALHIDSEGGLVHLRHALQSGPSLVFFGPSSPDVLGYSENLNLRGNGCPIFCEFYSCNWQEKCVLNKHVCMTSLKPKTVLEELNKQKIL